MTDAEIKIQEAFRRDGIRVRGLRFNHSAKPLQAQLSPITSSFCVEIAVSGEMSPRTR